MSSLASSPKEVLSSKSKASLQKPLVFDKAKLFELPCSKNRMFFDKNVVFLISEASLQKPLVFDKAKRLFQKTIGFLRRSASLFELLKKNVVFFERTSQKNAVFLKELKEPKKTAFFLKRRTKPFGF